MPSSYSLIVRYSSWLAAALLLLGLSGTALAQPNSTGTAVLGRALEDGPALPTYSMYLNCSESIAGRNCSFELASDDAFTKLVSDGGPRTQWGLRKDTTYYARVRSFAFMNGGMVWGAYSPVVKYKYAAPPKLPVADSTQELQPGLLGTYDCRGVQGTKLQPVAAMRAGDLVRSPNKAYELWYQADGNLVIYEMAPKRRAIWASGTVRNNPSFVRMLADGNLTVSHSESGPSGNPVEVQLWESKTAGHPNATAVLQNDGNLVIYDAKESCKAWWASKSSK